MLPSILNSVEVADTCYATELTHTRLSLCYELESVGGSTQEYRACDDDPNGTIPTQAAVNEVTFRSVVRNRCKNTGNTVRAKDTKIVPLQFLHGEFGLQSPQLGIVIILLNCLSSLWHPARPC